MEGLAAYIRARRLQLGMTQVELAEAAGVSQPVISDVERSQTKLPNVEARRGIARALGIRHVDLLVAAGELSSEEVPGFSAETPAPDPDLARRIAMMEALDWDRDNRGNTLDVVLQGWAAQDRNRPPHRGQHSGTRG
jgi:transcriptional regulator with XRE-family HTH domain